ncbi:MAG: alanine racemase [Candidatus Sumerlaeaceae bacterium]
MTATEPPLPREAYLSWLEIDLEAIRLNYRLMREQLRPDAALFAVIKADAYGHGALPVAKTLLHENPEMLCVARVEEAVELRDGGIDIPLLVLAPPFDAQAKVAVSHECAIVVCDPEHMRAMAVAARQQNTRARIHLKVDIGMGRLGALPQDVPALLQQIADTPELELEGVMSHFPCADAPPGSFTDNQARHFGEIVEQVRTAGMSVRYFHTANSAAILDHPLAHFNAARTGITLYGQYPGTEMERRLPLRPAMSMRTTVAFLKDVPAGTGLSYGHVYHTTRASRIAIVPLGYADGYPRHATNRGEMLVHGQRVPQVGRVCMDHVLLDVTDVPNVKLGDVVTAIGMDVNQVITAEELATRCDTIGYEITTRVGKRLPKFYSHG